MALPKGMHPRTTDTRTHTVLARRLHRSPFPSRALQALLSGHSVGGLPQGQKVYIDIMRVGPLDITLSFMPAPWDPQPGEPGDYYRPPLCSFYEGWLRGARLRC